jgi:glycosyltransferase involved in cell wall biosynthesis
MTVLVSVVIPTHNGARRLPDLFAALRAQTLGPDAFEVIVVDDASTDDTATVVEHSDIARLVRAPHSLGQGGATNLGIEHARGEIVAFTDDDTVPHPTWLEHGLRAIDRSPSGIVAGHIELMLADEPTVPALMDYGRGYLDQRSYVQDGFGATANLWVRRDVLESLGRFDAGAAWQTHDRDFGERARMAGLRMVYAADVVVAHPTRDHARELARVAYRLGLGAAWLQRHGVGAVRDRTSEWARPRYWIPWRTIWGIDRLQARGHATTRAQRLKLRAVQYCCLQMPIVAGSLRGSLREARARH